VTSRSATATTIVLFPDPSVDPHIITNTGGRCLIPAPRLLRRPPPDPLLTGLFLFLSLDPDYGKQACMHHLITETIGMQCMNQPVRHAHHRTCYYILFTHAARDCSGRAHLQGKAELMPAALGARHHGRRRPPLAADEYWATMNRLERGRSQNVSIQIQTQL
jgi:hypothetical protein